MSKRKQSPIKEPRVKRPPVKEPPSQQEPPVQEPPPSRDPKRPPVGDHLGDKKRGRESFFDSQMVVSIQAPPCHAGLASLLRTSPFMS